MKKKLIITVLTALILFLLSACKNDTPERPLNFVVELKNSVDSSWNCNVNDSSVVVLESCYQSDGNSTFVFSALKAGDTLIDFVLSNDYNNSITLGEATYKIHVDENLNITAERIKEIATLTDAEAVVTTEPVTTEPATDENNSESEKDEEEKTENTSDVSEKSEENSETGVTEKNTTETSSKNNCESSTSEKTTKTTSETTKKETTTKRETTTKKETTTEKNSSVSTTKKSTSSKTEKDKSKTGRDKAVEAVMKKVGKKDKNGNELIVEYSGKKEINGKINYFVNVYKIVVKDDVIVQKYKCTYAVDKSQNISDYTPDTIPADKVIESK